MNRPPALGVTSEPGAGSLLETQKKLTVKVLYEAIKKLGKSEENMFEKEKNLHQNEHGQTTYSTLFILLSLVVAGSVFAMTSIHSHTDVVRQVLESLALALFPILFVVSSALWLFGKSTDEVQSDTKT